MNESFTLYGGDGIQRSALHRLFPSQLDYPAPSIDQLGLLSTSTIIEETGDMGERGRVAIELNGSNWKNTYPDDDVALWSTICDLLISMRDTWSCSVQRYERWRDCSRSLAVNLKWQCSGE